MSIAVGAALSADPASWSLGPFKVEVQKLDIVSGDTGATVTAAALSRVDFAVVGGDCPTLTAQPTYSGAVVTLAFTDPAASKFASIILFGK